LEREPKVKEHIIQASGAKIYAIEEGEGDPVIFLHGGPGDTHHYMRRMAEPLFKDFRCVFFDQRGTGKSEVAERSSSSFSLDLLFDDLNRVAGHFNFEKPALVGHSWGAVYALYAAIAFPDQFDCIALLNMGPLTPEMEMKTSEHLISVLDEPEKEIWRRLRSERNEARERGDIDLVRNLDKEMMNYLVKAWVCDPELRESFLKDYFQDPPPDRDVNKWVWSHASGWLDWTKLKDITSKCWIAIGEKDSVPLAQFEKLNSEIPISELTVFKNCGHIPWLEHSDDFYQSLKRFLSVCKD
tara:strand:- start:1294 stop:2187 length:894 start_codon:yes stop_codon:yes gene_type:complete